MSEEHQEIEKGCYTRTNISIREECTHEKTVGMYIYICRCTCMCVCMVESVQSVLSPVADADNSIEQQVQEQYEPISVGENTTSLQRDSMQLSSWR